MGYLNVKLVSAQSTVPPATLYRWAAEWDTKPVGPRPRKLGPRQFRYRVEDVAEWLGVEPGSLQTLASA